MKESRMTQPQKLKPSLKAISEVRNAPIRSVADRKAFARSFAASLKGPLQETLAHRGKKPDVASLLKLVEKQLAVHLQLQRSSSGGKPVAKRHTLPIDYLKPAEVVARAHVAMSQATLYRAVADHRFYSVAPKGLSNGRVFPAWQFVDPVPDLLAPVLRKLAPSPPRTMHTFLVSEAEALNDLSPAEVLAGLPMESRGKLHTSQHRLLALPSIERQRLVCKQIARLSEHAATE